MQSSIKGNQKSFDKPISSYTTEKDQLSSRSLPSQFQGITNFQEKSKVSKKGFVPAIPKKIHEEQFQELSKQQQYENFLQLSPLMQKYLNQFQQQPQNLQQFYAIDWQLNYQQQTICLQHSLNKEIQPIQNNTSTEERLQNFQRKITILQNQNPLNCEKITNQEITEKQIEINKKKLKSLAERNIMHNFASGIRDFIKYKINKIKLIEISQEKNKIEELKKIHEWIKKNKNNFRCFVGWKEMSQNSEYGKQFLKICFQFFKEDFAFTYIQQSRINEQYKQEHYKKICKFEAAIKNNNLFNPNFFKK